MVFKWQLPETHPTWVVRWLIFPWGGGTLRVLRSFLRVSFHAAAAQGLALATKWTKNQEGNHFNKVGAPWDGGCAGCVLRGAAEFETQCSARLWRASVCFKRGRDGVVWFLQLALISRETGAFQWWGYSECDRASRFHVTPRHACASHVFCYCLLILVNFY